MHGLRSVLGVSVVGLMCVLCGIQVGDARTLDHSSGFAIHGDLMANGSAHFVGTTAVLTDDFGQAGSIFTVSPVQITDFSSDFEFTILPGTVPPADGMTFCIQNAAPSALGEFGSASVVVP